jgi:hypothetical protein
MREDNLLCMRKRKFIVTTGSHHDRKVYPMVLTGMSEARASLERFIEKIYNQKRLHSALGYLPAGRVRANAVDACAGHWEYHAGGIDRMRKVVMNQARSHAPIKSGLGWRPHKAPSQNKDNENRWSAA